MGCENWASVWEVKPSEKIAFHIISNVSPLANCVTDMHQKIGGETVFMTLKYSDERGDNFGEAKFL